MATNQTNTTITQVVGATLVIEFSQQCSHPFKVAMPGQFWPDGPFKGTPKHIVFTSQTKARAWVLANDPAFKHLNLKPAKV
jgi:hypothetical protein